MSQTHPNAPAGEACSNCKFFLRLPGDLQRGRCARFPPQLTHVPAISKGRMEVQQVQEWPLCSATSWCGEWKARLAALQ